VLLHPDGDPGRHLRSCGHVAHQARRWGALGGNGLAIAGLVTGYLGIALSLVVLPILLAIAIPNFVKARQFEKTNACIQNLRQIDNAKQQWALENKQEPTDTPTVDDIKVYIKGPQFPDCPEGGTYQINPVGKDPTCSIPDHRLPPP
jgi:competence protein ComGC